MFDKDIKSWNSMSGPKVKTVLATADYPMTYCKFEIFELEDGAYATHFFAYDAAGGLQSKYFDKVWDQYKEWCEGEEKHIKAKHKDPLCPKCHHKWYSHEQHVERWFDGKPGDYCMVSMGMGDPCGCAEKKP